MDLEIQKKLLNFFSKFTKQTYKKGEMLIRIDDTPSGIFFLKKGHVKKYAISQKGDELVVNIFKPISFFPMSWAMNDTLNNYYFETMTDVEVWKAPKEKVIGFIKEHPDILYDLLRRVFKGTDGMTMRMTYLMAGNAYGRLITELLIFSRRFGKQKEKGMVLEISENDLAAQSGMTRETVSREIKLLKDKGLVRLEKNKLLITNLELLEKELAGGV